MKSMKTLRAIRNERAVEPDAQKHGTILLQVIFLIASLLQTSSVIAQDSLEKYYVNYCAELNPAVVFSTSACSRFRYTGGIARSPLPVISLRRELPIGPVGPRSTAGSHVLAFFRLYPSEEPALPILYVYWSYPQCGVIALPKPFVGGSAVTQNVNVEFGGPGCEPFDLTTLQDGRTYADRYAFGAPIRRKAFDGSIFEASPMVQTRNGQPWITAYWGLNLGLVETQFDWDAAALALLPAFGYPLGLPGKEFEGVLFALPPPIIEGEITEYQNTLDFPNAPGGVAFAMSSAIVARCDNRASSPHATQNCAGEMRASSSATSSGVRSHAARSSGIRALPTAAAIGLTSKTLTEPDMGTAIIARSAT